MEMIINYLTDHPVAKAKEISEYMQLSTSRTADYLKEMIEDGLIVSEGVGRSTVYKLKS